MPTPRKKTVSKDSELLQAVCQQKYSYVKKMLKDGVDANSSSVKETTALHEAVRQDSIALVRLLVEAGADINRKAMGGTPLDLALKRKSHQIIVYLKHEGASTSASLRRKKTAGSAKKKKPGRKKSAGDFNRTAKKSTVRSTSVTGPEKSPMLHEETLADIFESKKWIGRVDKMQEEWEKVPQRLKKTFDFASILVEVRRKTLESRAPATPPLKRNQPKPPL